MGFREVELSYRIPYLDFVVWVTRVVEHNILPVLGFGNVELFGEKNFGTCRIERRELPKLDNQCFESAAIGPATVYRNLSKVAPLLHHMKRYEILDSLGGRMESHSFDSLGSDRDPTRSRSPI